MEIYQTYQTIHVYVGSERALTGIAKSVHFHDWLMNIEFNASRNF